MPPPVSARLAAMFAGFHVAVIAVFIAWYLSALYVWMVLATSGLSPVSEPVAILVVAPAVAGIVTWCFAKWLLRPRRHWIGHWLLATTVAAVVPLPMAFVLTTGLHVALRTHELTGPASPTGLTSIVAVSDAGLGWGADFYTDVRVLDGGGHVVAEWTGGSQWPRSGPANLRDSMRWTSPTTLEFTSRRGHETLRVQ